MRICVIGAGAMGCLYGARLLNVGCDVSLVDVRKPHVDAINTQGLLLDGIEGAARIKIAATTDPATVRDIDLAIILVDANSTATAGAAATKMLKPAGVVMTLQNGIGNLEALDGVLGPDRVLGGLSYHSAEFKGPGHVTHTHAGPTWIGPRGSHKGRTLVPELVSALDRARLQPTAVDDIELTIWEKWVLNSSINALCAITGLRQGEISRTPSVEAFQDHILDEVFAIVKAKKLPLSTDEMRGKIKYQCWKKFNKPSMLQHLEAGKRTEVDALNGAVAREGQKLGIPTPYNDALTLLIKGAEKSRRQALLDVPIDYARMEAEAAADPSAPGHP